MNYTATYSPDDNKLRLYPSGRLPAEIYARVKAAGFKWAPQQELFVAPMWTPEREDLLIELAGEIDDEDTSLTDRAEQRAERFEDYSDKRAADAESARRAVAAIADNIPLGQPILVGHHSERHARRDAEKIESGMRRAVKMWRTSEYWTQRAAGAIRHAKYKERPDVRARRIKGIEADLRKLDRTDKEVAATLRLWELVDLPEKWKPKPDGSQLTREERAAYVAGRVHCSVNRRHPAGHYWSAYDVLRLPASERYEGVPVMTIDDVIADVRKSHARATAYRARWREHYENRLAYERAMLADAGGTAADKTGPEKGGGCRCWASPRGGWSYIQKVNKVSVTVLDNWGNGGRNFTRTIPFDKLAALMSRAQVDQARSEGRLADVEDGRGFVLLDTPPPQQQPGGPRAERSTRAADFEAMQETLRQGVQVVSAPQLFPTPPDVAARMVQLAEIEGGQRVLEPSAGTGNILDAIKRRAAASQGVEIVGVEINPTLGGRLNADDCAVVIGDFLSCEASTLWGEFDRVVMNPPFENAADVKHIEHALAMLKPGGRIVAICANGPRQQERLRPRASSWEDLPAGTFAGTGVRAALLVIDKEAS